MRIYGPKGVSAWNPVRLENPPPAVNAEGPPPSVAAPRLRPSLGGVLGRFEQLVVEVAGSLLPGPALEFLGLRGRREVAAAFVEAAELADPFRVHEARADAAERQAILAPTMDGKRAFERLALDHWLRAAQFESPRKHSAHARAHLSLERLATFAENPGERALFTGLGALLDGEAKVDLAAAQANPGTRAAAETLTAGIERRAVEQRLDRLVHEIMALPQTTDPRATAHALLGTIETLGQAEPARSLELLALRREIQRLVGLPSDPGAITIAWEASAAGADQPALRGLRAMLELPTTAATTAHDPTVPDEVRFLARLTLAEQAKAQGEPQAAIQALELARGQAHGPERRGLTAILLAGALAEGDDSAQARADGILRRALDALDFNGGTWWDKAQRATHKVGQLIGKFVRGEALPTTRGPDPDTRVVINQLLLARAQLAVLRDRPHEARRWLEAVKPQDFATQATRDLTQSLTDAQLGAPSAPLLTGDPHGLAARVFASDPSLSRPKEMARALLQGARGHQLRLISAAPLARATGVPLSTFVDPHRLGETPEGVLDPVALRLAFVRAGVADQSPRPKSALAGLFLSPGDPLATLADAVVASKQLQGTFGTPRVQPGAEAFAAATARALAAQTLAKLAPPPKAPGVAAWAADDAVIAQAETTVALGLARPGDGHDFQSLAALFGTTPALSHPRPAADQVLAAATFLGRAAKLLEPTSPEAVLDARAGAQAEVRAAVEAALLTDPPATLAQAPERLRAAGFTEEAGLRFNRGRSAARLEPMTVGGAEGYSIWHEVKTSAGSTVLDRTVVVGGVSFSGADWGLFEHGRERELLRYRRARQKTRDPDRLAQIQDLAGLRQFIARGQATEKLGLKRAELAELAQLEQRAQTLLQQLQAQGKMPTGVYLMVDGIDAASKTSNGQRLVGLLEGAGFRSRWLSFKAPSAEERTQHYLARFDAHRPQPGEVFFADRSPLGDFAYNPKLDPEKAAAMGQDFLRWQRGMEDQDIEVIKFLFDPGDEDGEDTTPDKLPSLWRPMFTFGKRQARAEAAADLVAELTAKGRIPPAGLVEASRSGPGINDLKSFHNGNEVHQRFERAADLTAGDSDNPWVQVHTLDRHAGRLRVLQTFIQRLEDRLSR